MIMQRLIWIQLLLALCDDTDEEEEGIIDGDSPEGLLSIVLLRPVIAQVSPLASLCILSRIVAGVGSWRRALYVFPWHQMISSSFG